MANSNVIDLNWNTKMKARRLANWNVNLEVFYKKKNYLIFFFTKKNKSYNTISENFLYTEIFKKKL